MFKCTEISRAMDWPRLQSEYPFPPHPTTDTTGISFNFILRHWQFTKLQTQSLIASSNSLKSFQLQLQIQIRLQIWIQIQIDTANRCRYSRNNFSWSCPVEYTYRHTVLWALCGHHLAPGRASPASDWSCPALPVGQTVSQQECLDYSQARKNYFYLQVARKQWQRGRETETERGMKER